MRAIDPVCGMVIAWEEATDFEPAGGSVLYFCCPGCAARYREQKESPALPHWTRLSGACRESARSRTGFRGVGVPLAELPRIGAHTIDGFEALVVQRWRRTLGYSAGRRLICRTLERALLLLALGDLDDIERHRIEVLVAAEAGRLRTDDFVHGRALAEVEALPAVIEATLAGTGVDPSRAGRILCCVKVDVPAVLAAMQGQGIQWAASDGIA